MRFKLLALSILCTLALSLSGCGLGDEVLRVHERRLAEQYNSPQPPAGVSTGPPTPAAQTTEDRPDSERRVPNLHPGATRSGCF
jgi:hypothetical protein